jgi:subfamily B ATP-binding cassette protein MsbA
MESTPFSWLPRAKRFWFARILRSYWKTLGVALLAVLGETVADVLEPWPIKVIIDNVVQAKSLTGRWGAFVSGLFGDDRFAILYFALAAVVTVALVGAVGSYVEKYSTTSISQWVAHDLRRLLYQRIQRLSLAEHSEARVGDLLTHVTSDINAVQDFIDSALLGIIVNVLTLTGMAGVMLYVSWRFTLVALLVVPVLGLTVYFYTPRIKKASRRVKKRESELLSGVAEVMTAIHVVQAFGREDYEDRRFDWESRQNVEAGMQARSIKARLSPTVDVIIAFGTCLVLGYGARLAIAGRLSTGVLIVFLLYLGKMYKPLRDLSKMANTVSKAAVGYERIRELLATESRVQDLPGARSATTFTGEIELDRVSFKYDGGGLVLKDVSLHVAPGQIAAIVGPSGTGKTTIASLIPRFYDPLSGQVKIDGVDIREFTLKSLRDRISFVLQDTMLFRATIWENIAYGRPDAPPEETVRAAKLANAHDFIMNMPLGYATVVGERGATLSGGERRRIAIARAIVRNTPILILDEPTSGLDAASEQAVIEALQRLMEGRTSIVIAHHLHSIRHADIIFVIKDSEILEQGTHERLLMKQGLYARLYETQRTMGASNSLAQEG